MNSTIVSRTQEENGQAQRWLLLIVQLPPKPDYLRVKLRRRIQRVGALALRGAVYVLPERDDTLEDFMWLRGELVGDGGDALLCSAMTLAGVTDAQLQARFRELRKPDYEEIVSEARTLANATPSDEITRELARLRRRLDEVARLDFFESSANADAKRALDEVARASEPSHRGKEVGGPLRGRTWVTRAGVFVDRIASAWLIRRFIDPAAEFTFTPESPYVPRANEIRFDMYQSEYTHEGDRCTFETLLERFGLDQASLRVIAEIVHDIDCKDAKFERSEAAGVELVLRGLAAAEPDDARRIERGAAIFDGLFAQLGGAPGDV